MSARVTQRWTYIGRRIVSGGKIAYVWYDADGGQRSFKKALGATIPGQRFDVEFEPNPDGVGGQLFGMPVYCEPPDPDDERLVEWRTADKAAGVMKAAAQRKKKDEESDELQDALEVIRRHYQAARTWDQRAAFLAYVTNESTMPPTRRD